jgi:hypothetical protein
MPPVEAIKAATVMPPTCWCGRAGQSNSKSADIIAVTGDPLSDVKVLKKVGFVWRGDVVVGRIPTPRPQSIPEWAARPKGLRFFASPSDKS